MSLMAIYLTALLIGGVLLFVALFFGGDHDADIDADVDVDVDVDADADADIDHGGGFELLAWFPLTSLRFWTFFAAGFGLVGTIAAAAGTGSVVSLPASIAVGYVSGWAFTSVVRRLRKNETDSSLGESDYVGTNGVVVLPIEKGQTGKVRLHLKGRSIELLADTEDEVALKAKQAIMVYGMNENGHVLVARTEALPESSQ